MYAYLVPGEWQTVIGMTETVGRQAINYSQAEHDGGKLDEDNSLLHV